MRQLPPPSRTGLLLSVLLPATLLTLLMVGTSFLIWKTCLDRREAPIRREIAQNFAEKWGRCDLAAKWDSAVPCKGR